MSNHASNETTDSSSRSDGTDSLIDRVVTLGAKALATRLLIGGVGALAMLVAGYYFLVDRTLRPLEERVASLEATANSRLLSLEEGLRGQSAVLARIEEKLEGLDGTLGSFENSIGADVLELKVGAAQSILEQRDLAVALARLETKIEGYQDSSFDPEAPLDIPLWPEVFPSIDLDQWVIDVSGDRASPTLVTVNVPYLEPTEEEMLNALLGTLPREDMTVTQVLNMLQLIFPGQTWFGVHPIAEVDGLYLDITEFEKNSCFYSEILPGYSCTYAFSLDIISIIEQGTPLWVIAALDRFVMFLKEQPHTARSTFFKQNGFWAVVQN